MTVPNINLIPDLNGRRLLVACFLGAFIFTFLTTRFITKAIREGRGPFRDVSASGIHVHHQVYGIFLLLIVGTLEFTYQPSAPELHILAALFGVGAALTLDEFALWLRLEDVYWAKEGRSSVDAALIAVIVGLFLLLGVNPFDQDQSKGEVGAAISVLIGMIFAVVAFLKGRTVIGVIGIFLAPVGLIAACRLARPDSAFARRRYGQRKMTRSRTRFPPGRQTRWDKLVDLFAIASPSESGPSHDAAR
ncbi:MAG: hypothetical protein ABI137_05590 [Antricoccus sp.]